MSHLPFVASYSFKTATVAEDGSEEDIELSRVATEEAFDALPPEKGWLILRVALDSFASPAGGP